MTGSVDTTKFDAIVVSSRIHLLEVCKVVANAEDSSKARKSKGGELR